jgi:hypothetical protein
MSFESNDHRIGRHKAVWGGALRVWLALSLFSVAGCGNLVREGTGSSYLLIESFVAASGATPNAFSGTLNSDVQTFVDDIPTVFNDVAQATFRLGMKDVLTAPTANNFITITRYNVRYLRADGRNTPGVDVPSGFDGALTATIRDTPSTVGFELVRHIAKEQAPLRGLSRNFAVIISTIAEVTFYGRDQTGRDVSVTATILINFGDFGDPS